MVTTVSDANFQKEVIESSTPVIVDFWAPWCGPCKAMEPTIEKLSKDYEGRIKVCKMNVESNHNIPGKFRVRSLPSLMFFNNGGVVDQIVGNTDKQKIENIAGSILAKEAIVC